MFYYIQSNTPNEWMPAMESQVEVLEKALSTKNNINFVITDPKSGKQFNSVCHYIDEQRCTFENQETGVRRQAFLSETELEFFPEHNGIC